MDEKEVEVADVESVERPLKCAPNLVRVVKPLDKVSAIMILGSKGVWNLKSRLRIEDAHRGSLNHGVLIDLRRQLVRRASNLL